MNKNVKDIAKDFLRYIDQERNYSSHTVISYTNDLNTFIDFLKNYDQNLISQFNKIDRQTIRHYLGKEYESGKSSKTVARRLASIKSFFNFMVKTDLIGIAPTLNVKTPKVKQYIPSFIQTNKIERLMNLPDNTLKGVRDRAILELFYATGIRLSELVKLNIGSFDPKENTVRVLGKGGKERIIPFGNHSKSSIEIYLKKTGYAWSSDPKTPLFRGNKGKRISVRNVQYRVNKYLKQILGGEKSASPHTLRHTFGTHLLDNDADIRSIQELLGHRNISSTQIYTKVNPKKIKEIYENTHPHGR